MSHKIWRRHLRQGSLFLIIGAVQLALDSAVFIASTALGAPVIASNVAGRISGAVLGYWLNGRHTFPAQQGRASDSSRRLRRFAIAWLLLTLVSTTVLGALASRQELRAVWIAKPVVEALLAAVGFIVWRQWVFR
jgi:putative flippase GtrA